MTQSIHSHTFDNGLVLVAEPMASLESAAFTFLVPAGCCYDPADRSGLSALTCEMALRGAGHATAGRLLTIWTTWASSGASRFRRAHTSFSGATLADNLLPALSIYADVVRRPRLPADQLEPGRMVVLQELQAIEDEPAQLVMLELRRRALSRSVGAAEPGRRGRLEAITIDEIRGHFARLFRPNGTILGVAGRFDWEQLKEHVGQLLGDWRGCRGAATGDGRDRRDRDASAARVEPDPDRDRLSERALSPPRLFPGVGCGGRVERRDEFAAVHRGPRAAGALLQRLRVTPHAAGSGQCVLLCGHQRRPCPGDTRRDGCRSSSGWRAGIEEHELDRLKARIKSALIMQQESSSARSGAVARDWYHLGRVRTLDEVGRLVDELTCASINAYLADHPARRVFDWSRLGQRIEDAGRR